MSNCDFVSLILFEPEGMCEDASLLYLNYDYLWAELYLVKYPI